MTVTTGVGWVVVVLVVGAAEGWVVGVAGGLAALEPDGPADFGGAAEADAPPEAVEDAGDAAALGVDVVAGDEIVEGDGLVPAGGMAGGGAVATAALVRLATPNTTMTARSRTTATSTARRTQYVWAGSGPIGWSTPLMPERLRSRSEPDRLNTPGLRTGSGYGG